MDAFKLYASFFKVVVPGNDIGDRKVGDREYYTERVKRLDFDEDGNPSTVWTTGHGTALKVISRKRLVFLQEGECYLFRDLY